MSLCARLCGHEFPRIRLHAFTAAIRHVARGSMTQGQALTKINASSSAPLTTSEQDQAQELLGTITSLGNATAKLARAQEIDDILILGNIHTGVLSTEAEVKTELGVTL